MSDSRSRNKKDLHINYNINDPRKARTKILDEPLKLMLILCACVICILLFSSNPPNQRPLRAYPPQIELSLLESEDISRNTMTLTTMNNTFMNETNQLQTHLSHLLFWGDNDKDRSMHASSIAQTHVIQRNNAILKFYTPNSVPEWTSFSEFSIISTAFTQNYFLSVFKPDLMPDIRFNKLPSTILDYEPILFPWLKTSIKTLFGSFKGKGIVITSGNYHFSLAFLLVKTLREVIKCELPIEIAFADENDLGIEKRTLIEKFKNVKCINLSERLLANKLQGVGMHSPINISFNHSGGWWWKVYSVLLSSFSEVIFMDADVLFTVDPSILFQHQNYIKYGNLIFRDRQINLGNDYDRLTSAFQFASNTLKSTGLWNRTTTHEAESGVLVYNKAHPSAFFALLNTCNLDRDPMQKINNKFFHGDKETFWMGFELLNLPYAFMKPYGATIGSSPSPGSVCGSLAHSDETGKLLWFNGGLAVDKGSRADEIYDFQFYATDDQLRVGKWTWEEGHLEKLCWESADTATEVKALSDAQKEVLTVFVDYYKQIRRGEYLVSA